MENLPLRNLKSGRNQHILNILKKFLYLKLHCNICERTPVQTSQAHQQLLLSFKSTRQFRSHKTSVPLSQQRRLFISSRICLPAVQPAKNPAHVSYFILLNLKQSKIRSLHLPEVAFLRQ